MIRIAFIHNNFPAGGAERITVDIAEYLKTYGQYEVFVYATRVAESLMTPEIKDLLTVRIIPSLAVPARRAGAVEAFVVSDRIDILVQVGRYLQGVEDIKARTGCRTVLACHGEPFWQRHAIMHRRQKGGLRRIVWRLWNRRRFEDGTLAMKMAIDRTHRDYVKNDAYTVLCDSYRKEVVDALNLSPSDLHIYPIENPEREVKDVCYAKEKMFLFCGRFENWSKRIDRLLRIWARVEPVLPDWRLVLVGDGPDNKMLRKLADELHLERVSFEGMIKDVSSYYRRAWAVCLTSETEGWPLALTEAQAHGCIGVAFGCSSGIREILSPDGQCGFVVPPFDETGYAETLVKVAAMQEEEHMRIRMNGVQKRSCYTPEVIAGKWKVLFDSLYERKSISL